MMVECGLAPCFLGNRLMSLCMLGQSLGDMLLWGGYVLGLGKGEGGLCMGFFLLP